MVADDCPAVVVVWCAVDADSCPVGLSLAVVVVVAAAAAAAVVGPFCRAPLVVWCQWEL